jgi:lysophospholipase L1-like esterase
VLLASPAPIDETGVLADIFAGGATKSQAVPALLQQMAVHHGIGFAEMGAVTSVNPVDGIHLDEAAHAAMGAAMAEALIRHFS